MKNEIMEELHKTRDAHAKKFNYDLNAIYEDYVASQEKSGRPLVTLKPKLIPGRKKTKAIKMMETGES